VADELSRLFLEGGSGETCRAPMSGLEEWAMVENDRALEDPALLEADCDILGAKSSVHPGGWLLEAGVYML
jgi:hypothetical protein